MATVDNKFVGGATSVAQVDEQVYATATPLNDETTTYTLTDENNGAHVVIHTFSGTPADIEAGRDQLLTTLQASQDAEFQKITWTASGTVTILGTAKDAGRPFHLAVLEGAAWTVTDNDGGSGNSVANAGKNDWGTLANWEDDAGVASAAIPVANENVLIAEGSDSILYGLVTGINLSTLRRNANFTGSTGDPNGDGSGTPYPLRVDVNGSGAKKLTNDGRNGGAFLWRGTCPNVLWSGGLGTGLVMYVAGDVDNFRATGGSVRGRVQFADSMVLDNVYAASVSPAAVFDIGENVTSFDLIEADSGSFVTDTNPASIKVSGTASVEFSGDEDWAGNIENRGGRLLYTGEGSQTSGDWFQTSGSSLLRPRTSVAMNTVTVLGGSFIQDPSTIVTYSGTVTNYGGRGNVQVGDQAVATE